MYTNFFPPRARYPAPLEALSLSPYLLSLCVKQIKYTDAPSMPPSNYVALTTLEAEEVHSRIIEPTEDVEDTHLWWKLFTAKVIYT